MLACGTSSFFATSAGAQSASVSVSPSPQNFSMHSGTHLIVNVSVGNANGLYGHQYEIEYDSSVLAVAKVNEGEFLKRDGASTFCMAPDIGTPGRIKGIVCTRQAAAGGISGYGNLTRINFTVKQTVSPPLATQVKLVNVKLSDMNSQPIAYSVTNGTVNVKVCFDGEQKDSGSNVGECRSGKQTCSSNAWGACAGCTGPSAEICDNRDNDCDAQVDESLSRSCSVARKGICAAGTESCSAGTWSGCPAPQQEICLNGKDEDCDGADSACKGDVTGDGCIDINDLAAVGLDFGKRSGFLNAKSDTDSSGEVDIFDLVAIAKDYGIGC